MNHPPPPPQVDKIGFMFVTVGNKGGFKSRFKTVFDTLHFKEKTLCNGCYSQCITVN